MQSLKEDNIDTRTFPSHLAREHLLQIATRRSEHGMSETSARMHEDAHVTLIDEFVGVAPCTDPFPPDKSPEKSKRESSNDTAKSFPGPIHVVIVQSARLQQPNRPPRETAPSLPSPHPSRRELQHGSNDDVLPRRFKITKHGRVPVACHERRVKKSTCRTARQLPTQRRRGRPRTTVGHSAPSSNTTWPLGSIRLAQG